MQSGIKALIFFEVELLFLWVLKKRNMRRFFLKGGRLSANISEAMNKTPKLFFSKNEVDEERKKMLRVIYPIVDNEYHIIDILDYEQMNGVETINNSLVNVPLVIMAGGKGTRLYPYTEILPKPLIPIGDITITERIIHSFERYGCRKVSMILNYKANIIKAYMIDIKKEYEIDFIHEKEFLGTAGGLRLLKNHLYSTFFLSNCDVLIDADLSCVYKTHKNQKNLITFVCSVKNIEIPYGIVETDAKGYITKMNEKPDYSFMVNTGIYMLEPEALEYIEENEFIHMPDLAKRIIDNNGNVGVFPISDKTWLDMGELNKLEDMKKALNIKILE